MSKFISVAVGASVRYVSYSDGGSHRADTSLFSSTFAEPRLHGGYSRFPPKLIERAQRLSLTINMRRHSLRRGSEGQVRYGIVYLFLIDSTL